MENYCMLFHNFSICTCLHLQNIVVNKMQSQTSQQIKANITLYETIIINKKKDYHNVNRSR